MPAQHRVTSILLGSVLFCSGATALVYEVIWQRQFALLFGSGAPATAIVLAAYFAGLGLGSFIFGRWAGRRGKPLRWYAALELAIGCGALMVAPLLSSYAKLYPGIVANFGGNGTALLAVKGTLAFVAIVIPTAAMGGTLPVLAELVDRQKEQLGLRVGWLYVVNTAGAALGAAAVPYVLLPWLGTSRTVLSCAAINVAIGLAALWMNRRWREVTMLLTGVPKKPQERGRAWLTLAFVSGAGTFALQVLWNRAFAQVHENSIHSFAVIATVFIIAIALGAQGARWLLRKGIRFEKGFGTAWIIGGLAVGFCPALFIAVTHGLDYLRGHSTGLLMQSAGLILVPVALLATGMPLLFQKLGSVSKNSAANVTGQILAANIAGSIVGALAGGFALPKLLGMWNTMIATGALFAVAGAWVLWKSAGARLGAILGALALAWLQHRADLPRVRVEAKQGERVAAVEEGAHGIAAVTERAGSRRLKLNNHYTLGGTFATGDERVQAHIPLLIHPRPRRAIFLGFGTGITAGGALFHPAVTVETVELVPEVLGLAEKYFADENGNFHAQTNARVIVDDARNFLRGSRAKFDVIVSDIVVPWQQGEAALYTVEHFTAAKRALNSNGVFCVWAPLFQLGETEFQILLRTFASVFGRAQVWRGDFSPTRPALALVASDRALNEVDVQRRLSEMKSDPSNPHVQNTRAFWMHFIGIVESHEVMEKRINSEDRPWLELLAPRHEERGTFFTGRRLEAWEKEIAKSDVLTGDAAAGQAAGRLMMEFTMATSEGQRPRAEQIQARLREMLGEEAFGLVFGVR
jgi:spermidine synthase